MLRACTETRLTGTYRETSTALLRAKDGMPICAACGKEFKQWKGLRDHLLSGACSRPHHLRSLSTTPEAQVQSEALMALASFRAKVQGAPKQSLGGLASSPEAQGVGATMYHLRVLDAGSH